MTIFDSSGRPMRSHRAAEQRSQELAGWSPRMASTDGHWLPDREVVSARVEDIVRNNGWASGAIQRYLDQIIGSNLRLSWRPNVEALGLDNEVGFDFVRSVEQSFRRWATDSRNLIDCSRRYNFAGLLGILLRQRIINGECVALIHWLEQAETPYRTALQPISPDRLCNPMGMPDSDVLRGGIERNNFGRPLAYHIREALEGDYYSQNSGKWSRVERTTAWGRLRVLHFFEPESFEQSRGKSMLTPILEQLKMEDKYARSELQAALLNAVLAAYVESPLDHSLLQDAMNGNTDFSPYQDGRAGFHGENPISIGGTVIPSLFPGEKIGFADTKRPNQAFPDFEATVLRHCATGLGWSYEQMTQDWTKTNYSSARAALMEVWKFLTARRDHFTAGTATPIFALWLEDALDIGLIVPPPGTPGLYEAWDCWISCRWTGPGRGWIDPVKEAQASETRMAIGISTLQQEAADQGQDWEDVLAQLARERRVREIYCLPVLNTGKKGTMTQGSDNGDSTEQ